MAATPDDKRNNEENSGKKRGKPRKESHIYLYAKEIQQLSRNVFYLRMKADLSQSELATKTFIDRATMNRIENGHYNVAFGLVVRLARTLSVSIDDLATKELDPLAKVGGSYDRRDLQRRRKAG